VGREILIRRESEKFLGSNMSLNQDEQFAWVTSRQYSPGADVIIFIIFWQKGVQLLVFLSQIS
jgi:hypothetical protein